MKRTPINILAALLAMLPAGCIVDDGAGVRTDSPSASVPDSGSPVRRESAAETLRENDPAPPQRTVPDDETLDVPPPPPPPPVR